MKELRMKTDAEADKAKVSFVPHISETENLMLHLVFYLQFIYFRIEEISDQSKF